eukprot:CAMPEP_0185772158 /NCGR_PEP_ID=MMETSP1174-20130828/67254_1 /TAXON_ID=35687 /ORGANISM="Dictyocha speculum, Strain CCMP1381" /LENGTH=55 /DNA_ID=CAMNT_0028458273 /DNA_START=32 /DNA_END=196 /DNA_ORIENTATION=-
MARNRHESTFESFKKIRVEGGGYGAFWSGTSAKMVESATKGAILLFAKEGILGGL